MGIAILASTTLIGCAMPGSPAQGSLQVLEAGAPVSSYHFGNGIVAVPGASVTFSIANQGGGEVDLGGSAALAVSGADAAEFSASDLGAVRLAGGQSTTFRVSFNPQGIGARAAVVTIAPASGARSVSFSVSGTGTDFGVEHAGTAVSSYDFGTQTVMTSVPVSFQIVNQGSTALTLDPISIEGSDASDFALIDAPPPTVDAGTGVTFTLAFVPGSSDYETPRTATVTASAAGATPYQFTVHAMGTSGFFELRDDADTDTIADGTRIDFGTLYPSSPTSRRTFIIHNRSTGDDPLHVTHAISGDTGGFYIDLMDTEIPGAGTHAFTVTAGTSNPIKNPLPDGAFDATLILQTSDALRPTLTLHLAMVYSNSLPP